MLDESAAEKELEALIGETYEEITKDIKREDEELARQEAAAAAAAAAVAGEKVADDAEQPGLPEAGGEGASQSLTSKHKQPKRRLTHASTTELNFATKRQADEAAFRARIDSAYEKVVESMQLEKREDPLTDRQLYHCLGVIEHLRR